MKDEKTLLSQFCSELSVALCCLAEAERIDRQINSRISELLKLFQQSHDIKNESYTLVSDVLKHYSAEAGHE